MQPQTPPYAAYQCLDKKGADFTLTIDDAVARCLAAHGVPERARVEARFRAPVLLPGTVTYAADGERFELRGSGGRVHVSGTVSDLGAADGAS